MLWADMCQLKILKMLSLPIKSPLSLQHLASCRGGESLLVWLPEFTCLSAKTYIPLPPNE